MEIIGTDVSFQQGFTDSTGIESKQVVEKIIPLFGNRAKVHFEVSVYKFVFLEDIY